MPQDENTTARDQPRHTEWWVCCYQEDVEHFGSIELVPAEKRFVGYYSDWGDGGKWERPGAEAAPAHGITPIRKVNLA